jgi:pyruvate dehydrogenase (quinone)
MEQEAEGYPEYETDLQNPDYVALATAMGGVGWRAEDPDVLTVTLREALQNRTPALVEVLVNPGELTWP